MPPRSRSQAQAGDKDLPPVPTTAQENSRSITEQDPELQKKAEQTLKDKAAGGSDSQAAGDYTKLPEKDGKTQMRTSDGTEAGPVDTVQVTDTKDADPDNAEQPSGSEAVSTVMPAQYDIKDEDILPPQSR